MARQSRSTSTSTRRAAPPPTRMGTSTRTASTTSSVPAASPASSVAPPAPPVSGGGGMFANIASTAVGVGIGSAVGHTVGAGLSSMFFGGSKEPSEPVAAASAANSTLHSNPCEADSRAFTACLEKSPNDISACQFYLDMLKQCQTTYASNARPFAA